MPSDIESFQCIIIIAVTKNTIGIGVLSVCEVIGGIVCMYARLSVAQPVPL